MTGEGNYIWVDLLSALAPAMFARIDSFTAHSRHNARTYAAISRLIR